jgi:hypothetical protein
MFIPLSTPPSFDSRPDSMHPVTLLFGPLMSNLLKVNFEKKPTLFGYLLWIYAHVLIDLAQQRPAIC